MPNCIVVKKKIRNFNKSITVPGDKSLSIRWVLLSSLASGVSNARNLLMSEDVKAAINAIRKLGIKVNINDKLCRVFGKGIHGYKYKNNLTLNAENSGTLGRLILGLIINSPYPINVIGDKSLSKRDFRRVSAPLSKFGVKFKLKKNKYLPLKIFGSSKLKPIKYDEKRGSAQCKSSVIFAGMRTEGKTIVKAKKSRNHTELLCKFLNLPIKVKERKNFDQIEVQKVTRIRNFNYNIPSDISSSAFFIVLTALSNNSKLIIKNVNINKSRVGVVTILKKMGVKINFKNKKKYRGELIADIKINSCKSIKPIICPSNLNSAAIDEFLIIFLVAAKANGISIFKKLDELNQKESPRLRWAEKILSEMGVKTVTTDNSIKIFGNPDLKIKKTITIKKYLKDHRIFMTCVIAALSFGGNWVIHDKDSINTSFPNFLKIINNLKKND